MSKVEPAKKSLHIREDKIKTLEVNDVEGDARAEEDVVKPSLFPAPNPKNGRA
jgi:hypothetical protein